LLPGWAPSATGPATALHEFMNACATVDETAEWRRNRASIDLPERLAMPDDPYSSNTQPLPVMGVVRRGLRLYTENAGTIWRVVAPLAIVSQFVVFVATVSATPAGSIVANGVTLVPPGSSVHGLVLAHLLSYVVLVLMSVVSAAAASLVCVEAACGRSHEAGAALRFAFSRLGSLLWLAIVAGILVTVGFVLLVIPGIYLSVAFVAAVPVLVVENLRGGAALTRSRELTKGRWWPTLGVVVIAGVPVAVGSVVIGLILRLNGSVSGAALAAGVAGFIAQVLLAPFAIAVSVAIYLDLRGRKEPGPLGAPSFGRGLPPLSSADGGAATIPPTSPASGDVWWP
jgi:hypothetical protein